MSELIWNYSFPMRHGKYDNDYEFYSDGSIKHIYDQHDWKIDVEEFVKPSSISLKERQTMLEECPEDIRERIKAILEL